MLNQQLQSPLPYLDALQNQEIKFTNLKVIYHDVL